MFSASYPEDAIHLVIPMSGMGQRFRRAGYIDPKPLIPVSGIPMIERVLSQFPREWPCTFILSENHRPTRLNQLLTSLRPEAKIVWIDEEERDVSPFKGPALALQKGLNLIPPDSRVLVSYCDYGMIWDASYFGRFVRDTDCDACLISYRGFHAHYLSPTMYAYARLEGEQVAEVREKGCFTHDREREYASAGAYYFKSARRLLEALDRQVADNLAVQDEHYTSLTVEALMRLDPLAHVRIFEIPGFCQWGTPDDLRTFEYWEKTFAAWNARAKHEPDYHVDQILIPMAGRGSRFQRLSHIPKPFIPIGDQPMFALAHNSLPRSDQSVFVTLEDHRPYWNQTSSTLVQLSRGGKKPSSSLAFLKDTPPGQALSTELGLSTLDMRREVLVSACDHEIVLHGKKWHAFHREPRCDGAIFTIQGFPGATRQPNAFAYVIPKKSADSFPLVEAVSVKIPVSSIPHSDHLLTGTFWFRTGALLAEYLQILKSSGPRVNGELYLDSIFNLMIEAGLSIRMIPLDGYIGRGDPDSLAESVYYQELFGGRSITLKRRYPPPVDSLGALP